MPGSFILGARIEYFLDLADNPLSSAQCLQFIAQPRKPTTQGSFIDEAQAPAEIRDRSILINRDIHEALTLALQSRES